MAPHRNRSVRKREGERGFALLLIFLMASVLAISLYYEIPRVAMQDQRDKEQILIDRGEQYKRAIQLFVKKAGRYPGDIKELESFQNQRFLRQRYIDPMTGKDEWRLIHIQNGILTDSKLSKPNQPGQKDGGSTAGQFVGEQLAIGATPTGPAGGGAANVRDRRRPSEAGNASMPGADVTGAQTTGIAALPGQNGQPVPGQNLNPVQPGIYPTGQPMPGAVPTAGLPAGAPGTLPPGVPPMPGAGGIQLPGGANTGVTATNTGGGFVGGGGAYVGGGGSFVGGGSTTGSTPTSPTGQPMYPGQQIPGQQIPGQQIPGQVLPGQPGPPANSQNFGGTPAYATAAGSQGTPPGFPQPGTTTGQQGSAAADMIRNILTTPRPGGMPTAAVPGAQTIGGGIAGVASTAEGEGIKVYNDRTLYQEWEFIFDPQKQKQIPNPNAQGAGGTPADRLGTPAGQQNQQNQQQRPPGIGGPGFGQGR